MLYKLAIASLYSGYGAVFGGRLSKVRKDKIKLECNGFFDD